MSLALPGRADRDVNPGVAVHRIRLLVALDHADRLAVHLDEEARVAFLTVHGVGNGLVRVAPPSSDRGIAEDLEQPAFVAGLDGAQDDALAPELRQRD